MKSQRNYHYVEIGYPKCGRTWLRYMINQAEAYVYGIPLENTVHGVSYPQYGLPRMLFIHGFEGKSPINKYNLNFENCIKNVNLSKQKGHIFLVRAPERVMISYFHHCLFRSKKYPSDNISEFIRDPFYGIKYYVEYVDFFSIF